MVTGGSLFSQILSLVDREVFGRIVRELKAEKGAKGFSCWDQLVAMLFCQLAQAKSIREIEGGLRSCEGKLRHLGLQSAPKRSTLSYANAHRPWQAFEQLFYSLLGQVQQAAHAGGVQIIRRKLSRIVNQMRQRVIARIDGPDDFIQ